MRAAVASTGLAFEEIDEERAAEFESLSAVLRLQLAGRLSRREYLCEAAARSGKLEVLKWLRAGGCPWDTYTCCGAARSGHLEVLQWARENVCPWDEKTCCSAALGGNLDLLQWAEKGLYVAAKNGHETVLRALIELGADIEKAKDIGATPLYTSAYHGHETVVRALIESGADVNKAMDDGRSPLSISMAPTANIVERTTRRLSRFSGMPARCDDRNDATRTCSGEEISERARG